MVMTFLGYYAAFCIITAISALYELFIPALKHVQEVQPDNTTLKSKWLLLSVLFFGSALFAPVMLPIIFIQKYSIAFCDPFIESIKD